MVMKELSPRIRKSPTAVIIYRMMPVSQKGLKERMGMHKDAIWRAIKLLREHKLIYITGYESDNHTLHPMYAAGNQPDAVRPTAKELANARSNRYKGRYIDMIRAKDKAYKEKNREILAAKSRARYAAKKDAINAIARAKRAAAKEPVKVVTQWRTAPPWSVVQ
jgi:uncharacterized protein YegP (UPF0339 family)